MAEGELRFARLKHASFVDKCLTGWAGTMSGPILLLFLIGYFISNSQHLAHHGIGAFSFSSLVVIIFFFNTAIQWVRPPNINIGGVAPLPSEPVCGSIRSTGTKSDNGYR